MKTVHLSAIAIIIITSVISCNNTSTNAPDADKLFGKTEKTSASYNKDAYNNTKGCCENGDIIPNFYCPDAVSNFPPINIKEWEKVPAVNGRLPTYEETINGTAIHHYGEKANNVIKPYPMTLPKLARYIGTASISINSPKKDELVVAIQIVQTAKDTIVGYRFLTGGVGGSKISDYHFLNDEEIKKAIKQPL